MTNLYFRTIMCIFAVKIRNMEKIIAENIKRICKAQGKQLKDLAVEMGIDPPSLNRAMYGNPQLSTIEKAAAALGVSCKSLFEPINESSIEGYLKMGGKIYQFNSREELESIINK